MAKSRRAGKIRGNNLDASKIIVLDIHINLKFTRLLVQGRPQKGINI